MSGTINGTIDGNCTNMEMLYGFASTATNYAVYTVAPYVVAMTAAALGTNSWVSKKADSAGKEAIETLTKVKDNEIETQRVSLTTERDDARAEIAKGKKGISYNASIIQKGARGYLAKTRVAVIKAERHEEVFAATKATMRKESTIAAWVGRQHVAAKVFLYPMYLICTLLSVFSLLLCDKGDRNIQSQDVERRILKDAETNAKQKLVNAKTEAKTSAKVLEIADEVVVVARQAAKNLEETSALPAETKAEDKSAFAKSLNDAQNAYQSAIKTAKEAKETADLKAAVLVALTEAKGVEKATQAVEAFDAKIEAKIEAVKKAAADKVAADKVAADKAAADKVAAEKKAAEKKAAATTTAAATPSTEAAATTTADATPSTGAAVTTSDAVSA